VVCSGCSCSPLITQVNTECPRFPTVHTLLRTHPWIRPPRHISRRSDAGEICRKAQCSGFFSCAIAGDHTLTIDLGEPACSRPTAAYRGPFWGLIGPVAALPQTPVSSHLTACDLAQSMVACTATSTAARRPTPHGKPMFLVYY
jgi:hypothetical protein